MSSHYTYGAAKPATKLVESCARALHAQGVTDCGVRTLRSIGGTAKVARRCSGHCACVRAMFISEHMRGADCHACGCACAPMSWLTNIHPHCAQPNFTNLTSCHHHSRANANDRPEDLLAVMKYRQHFPSRRISRVGTTCVENPRKSTSQRP